MSDCCWPGCIRGAGGRPKPTRSFISGCVAAAHTTVLREARRGLFSECLVPRRPRARALPPSCVFLCTANVQLFPARIQEPAGGCCERVCPTRRSDADPERAALTPGSLRLIGKSLLSPEREENHTELVSPRHPMSSEETRSSGSSGEALASGAPWRPRSSPGQSGPRPCLPPV